MEWLYAIGGVLVGIGIGWILFYDRTSVEEKRAIRKATKKLDKGSRELQETVDKNKL